MRPTENNYVRLVEQRRNQIEAIRGKYWLSPEQAPEEADEEENDTEYDDEPDDSGN